MIKPYQVNILVEVAFQSYIIFHKSLCKVTMLYAAYNMLNEDRLQGQVQGPVQGYVQGPVQGYVPGPVQG